MQDGSVNAAALPNPPKPERETQYIAPRNEHERKIQLLWQKVLKSEDSISVDADFFEVGGGSLSLVRCRVSYAANLESKCRARLYFHIERSLRLPHMSLQAKPNKDLLLTLLPEEKNHSPMMRLSYNLTPKQPLWLFSFKFFLSYFFSQLYECQAGLSSSRYGS